jgi:hypothetical protein
MAIRPAGPTSFDARLCIRDGHLQDLSDPLLADYLCQGRAIFPYSCNEDEAFLVECLTPLRKIGAVVPYPLSLDYIVARQVESENARRPPGSCNLAVQLVR